MKRERPRQFAFFVAFALLLGAATSASAARIQWTVRGMQADGTSLLTLADAEALLNGQTQAATDVAAHFNTLNFNEPDHPLGGHFPGDVAFPGTSAGHEQDFAASATASIKIPSAGKYTFGVSSDDGFSMTVGANSMSFPGLRAPAESYATFDFAKAGTYPVNVVYYQHLTAAELEVFATSGVYTKFGQAGSNFKLVGDSTHGGLTLINPGVGTGIPEPSSLALVAIFLGGLLSRRAARAHRTN